MMRLDDREWNVFSLTGEDGLFPIHATSTGIDGIKLKDGDDTNPLPDEPGKTCRDVGSKRRYDDRCRTDPVWQTYNRAYKAHYARYMKKKMTAARRPRRIRGVVKTCIRTPRPCGS